LAWTTIAISSATAATAAAITASTSTPAASATTAFLARARFRNGDVAAINIFSGQCGDGSLGFLGLGHGDERESARAARDAIRDEVDIFHHTMSGEKILKAEFSGFEGKVSDEKFVVHDTNLLGLTDYSFGLFPTAGFQIITEPRSPEIHHVLESQSCLRREKTATSVWQIKREFPWERCEIEAFTPNHSSRLAPFT
jgi:hypothetical protein